MDRRHGSGRNYVSQRRLLQHVLSIDQLIVLPLDVTVDLQQCVFLLFLAIVVGGIATPHPIEVESLGIVREISTKRFIVWSPNFGFGIA